MLNASATMVTPGARLLTPLVERTRRAGGDPDRRFDPLTGCTSTASFALPSAAASPGRRRLKAAGGPRRSAAPRRRARAGAVTSGCSRFNRRTSSAGRRARGGPGRSSRSRPSPSRPRPRSRARARRRRRSGRSGAPCRCRSSRAARARRARKEGGAAADGPDLETGKRIAACRPPSSVRCAVPCAIELVPTMPRSWPVQAKIAAIADAGVKAIDCIPEATAPCVPAQESSSRSSTVVRSTRRTVSASSVASASTVLPWPDWKNS